VGAGREAASTGPRPEGGPRAAGSIVADDPVARSYPARFAKSFMNPESVATHSGSTAL